MIDLCVVGDLKWLVALSMPHIPLPGEVTFVSGIERMLGNDAAIVSLLAARLGLRCQLLATNAIAIHDGQPLIDMLQREGIDLSYVDTRGITTPTTFLLSQAGSDERTWMIEEHAFYNPASDLLPASKFAYIDVYEEHIKERLALIERWSRANVRCLVNLSATHIEEKVKLLAPIPSIDTIQIGGDKGVDESRIWGRNIFQMCNAKAVIITLGGLGTVLIDQHDSYYVPAESIQLVRTIGAGASFTAGFLSALAQDATYKEAIAVASKHAARFCTLEKNPLNRT
jgi:sugar/nucleoside kinase (ribokinase family)